MIQTTLKVYASMSKVPVYFRTHLNKEMTIQANVEEQIRILITFLSKILLEMLHLIAADLEKISHHDPIVMLTTDLATSKANFYSEEKIDREFGTHLRRTAGSLLSLLDDWKQAVEIFSKLKSTSKMLFHL